MRWYSMINFLYLKSKLMCVIGRNFLRPYFDKFLIIYIANLLLFWLTLPEFDSFDLSIFLLSL